MISLDLIGRDKPRHDLCVYLKWDRYSALADYILSRYGLEVPLTFEMPKATNLDPIKNSVCDWPTRIVVEPDV